MKLRIGAFALSAFSLTSVQAGTLSLDLTSTSQFDAANSTGVWNTLTGRITGAIAPSGTHAKRIDFGDGSDGAFNDGASVSGITVAGSVITVNTSTREEYNFTSFTLTSGKTLNVTGTKPLVIRAYGNVTIDGDIVANGGDGAPNGGTGHNAGGVAVGGGGDGGKSGSATAGGDPGSPGYLASGTHPNSGGKMGDPEGTFVLSEEGGGGGCNGTGADAANDATFAVTNDGISSGVEGVCSLNRAAVATGFETLFTGGAGGGGGGAWIGASPISGAGGGAGGGAVRFVALGSVAINGTIQAKGGKGGNNPSWNGSTCGGAGGGGAGGSVWVQASNLISGAGAVDIRPGAVGTDTPGACPNGNDGGKGSRGVFRADSADASYAGPATDPASVQQFNQVSTPLSQEYVVYTQPLDFSSRFVTFSTPTETTACGGNGTLAVTYEGSYDTVNWEKSVSGTNIAELDPYPYIRIKVSVTANGASPPCLTALSIPYELKDLPELTLKGGLFCGRISPISKDDEGPSDPTQGLCALIIDLGLLALAVASARRWRIAAR